MDQTIINIIDRKHQGIDCTEEESGEIKGWLRELRMVGEQRYVAIIQRLFPQEYNEYITELDRDEHAKRPGEPQITK